jgi:hypothetical protein
MAEDRTGRALRPDGDTFGGYRILERLGASAGARLVRARRPDAYDVTLRLVEEHLQGSEPKATVGVEPRRVGGGP